MQLALVNRRKGPPRPPGAFVSLWTSPLATPRPRRRARSTQLNSSCRRRRGLFPQYKPAAARGRQTPRQGWSPSACAPDHLGIGYLIPGAHPRGPFPSSKLRWKRNLRWAHPWTEAFPDAAGVVILQHPVERLSLLDHGQHLLDKLPPTLRKRRRRGGRQTCRARTHRASDGRALRLPAFHHIKEGSPEEIEETGNK